MVRKERLIVPALIVVAMIWAVAQYLSGLLFERELERAVNDLEARGELVVERSDVRHGWLTSRGTIHVAPVLGDAWHLALSYEADHGVLSTRVEGLAMPLMGPHQMPVFGDALPSNPPSWHALYHTLSGTLEGSIQLAPFLIRQGERELDFQGGELAFNGEYGDWRGRARISPLRLTDGSARLDIGPVMLESRYAYTPGAYHFTQHDLLRVEALSWQQPDLGITAHDLIYQSQMTLDERELRIDSELTIREVLAAEEVLLTGRVALSLSRVNADALRQALGVLRSEAAQGDTARQGRELLETLEPYLVDMLHDSPRLDATAVELDSPMLGIGVQGSGALFFDARDLGELSLLRLSDETEQQRWMSRLDGDFDWPDVPTVVALWLGLPLDTRDLEIDVIRGRVRVNGRPLPPLWR
ncbi:DUF945 family protein [Halomonas sp. TRM85114]|uniref:DUF945 family protein n=1 Tax=Halomonas jincaotanensis TaxID=2810616 RepID=UPI001BD6AF71|nr:DUF945 family protein [Halomonas jincaotanensis]MBS9402952.1 DUF945 family protein [Halomonas jincaotanensis]